jgi:HD superfamily phosphohydrolase
MGSLTELLNTEVYKKVENEVEVFVKEKLDGYKAEDVDKKTIRDSVWGSIEFSEWEMQLVDAPLFQRLRDIYQVGLVLLTYPASRHSRFEHSLGVVAAAKRICRGIKKNSNNFKLEPDEENSICLAALLHDIGHCFFSHLSESIYGELDDFVELKKQFINNLGCKSKAHEIMSFIIINTETFKTFFLDHIHYPNKNRENLFHDVGRMIVGSYIEKDNRIYSYLTSIINGLFDADKLDYIKRDSLTTGLSLAYDVERLLTKIIIHDITKNDKIEYRLAIRFNGITAVEELTFCKIMLVSYLYQHQKVLIADEMVKDYVHGLYELKIINNYGDFLRYTDSNILDLGKKQENKKPFSGYDHALDLVELADRIRQRRLPKRCYELTQTNVTDNRPENNGDNMRRRFCQNLIDKCKANEITVEEIERDIQEYIVTSTKENPTLLDTLISDIYELTYDRLLEKREEFYKRLIKEYNKRELPINFNLFDVYIVFPKKVSYDVSDEKVILGKDKKELFKINDFVKLDDWASSFNSNKWRGYVFVSEKIKRSIAFTVAEEYILKGKAKIKNPSAYIRGIND